MKWNLIKTYNRLINYNGPGRVNSLDIDYFFSKSPNLVIEMPLYLKAAFFSYYLTSIEKGKLKKAETITIVKLRDPVIRIRWRRQRYKQHKYDQYEAFILSPSGAIIFTLVEEIEDVKPKENHKD